MPSPTENTIAIADGRKSLEEVRATTNERKEKHRTADPERPFRSAPDNRLQNPSKNNRPPHGPMNDPRSKRPVMKQMDTMKQTGAFEYSDVLLPIVYWATIAYHI